MVEDCDERREGRGRSEKKRAAQAFEALAVKMVEASEAECDRFALPKELLAELALARRITARSGRKRQIKRLAGLLRRDEATVAGIQAVFEASGRASRAERERFQHIEAMRDALCDPNSFPAAIDAAARDFPTLDRKALTRLAEKVHRFGDKKASREIFRRLRKLMEAGSAE